MDRLEPLLQLELVGRLVVSVLLGGVLGWERQLGQHPAGLRTHILVSLGAAAYTVAGTYGVSGFGTVQDAGRVAAQVVAGIGFLGAGTIWRSGSDRIIYGLTTAASIWVAASIGMLSGYGLYVLALGVAVLGFTVLRLLKGLEEAPERLRLPRWRRRVARPQAAGAEQGLRPGVSVSGTGYAPGERGVEAPLDGEQVEETEETQRPEELEAMPALRADRRHRKLRGKKARKAKRRDVEREAMVEISDAPVSPVR